jgi:hypothetical protein
MIELLQQRVVRLTRHLSGVEESVSWNTPCLKVGKKLLIRVRDDDHYMLPFSRHDRDLLVEMAPDIYSYTDHFRNYDYVLVRAAAIGDEELLQRIEAVWRQIAPKRLQQSLRAV